MDLRNNWAALVPSSIGRQHFIPRLTAHAVNNYQEAVIFTSELMVVVDKDIPAGKLRAFH